MKFEIGQGLTRIEDHRLVTGTDDEDVGGASGKLLTGGVLQVHDFERTDVLFAALNDADATGVATAGDHAQGADIETDEIGNLVGGDVHHAEDGVPIRHDVVADAVSVAVQIRAARDDVEWWAGLGAVEDLAAGGVQPRLHVADVLQRRGAAAAAVVLQVCAGAGRSAAAA